jgi:hypothetical protein
LDGGAGGALHEAAALLTGRGAAGYGVRSMEIAARVDQILATLNATEVGTLDSIAAKLRQVQADLEGLDRKDLAERAAEAVAALARGDVAEFKRGRAYLQSKIGHLR